MEHWIAEGVIHPGWKLKKALKVQVGIDREGDGYCVSDGEIGIYGVGGNLVVAREDYVVSLIEYYGLLEEAAVKDSATERWFRRLQGYLERV